MLATFCVAGVTKAETDWPLEGRWAALNQSLTLDLLRCGDGWCGVEVTKSGSCGRTILRVANGTGDNEGQLTGRLDRDPQAQPYAIAINLYRRNPNEPGTMMISGHSRSDTVTEFRPWRRVYPYMVSFTRVGDPACTPKVS